MGIARTQRSISSRCPRLGSPHSSEQNIEKLIKPLFLDELRAEFERIKHNRNKLFEFHKKLRTLTFLDPACGCGNFLVVTYRALRELELDVLRAAYTGSGQLSLDVHGFINIDVDQFFGIEIEEFPARIAEAALWLTDHQMNVKVGEEFGMYFARIPLRATPHIHNDNALRMDWEDVVPKVRLSYILGNPPFGGHHYQSPEQKADQANVLSEISAHGVLDFVSNWFIKSADFVREATHVKAALVSTNSITQGEQVGLLWPALLKRGIHIRFAHRTFQWSNEARKNAAVHCVIIGFGAEAAENPVIFDYAEPKGEPLEKKAGRINPYLVDAPNVLLANRRSPICDVPAMIWGNKPTDGGNLILSPDERRELLAAEPAASPYVRRFMSGGDFINDRERYCLWLVEVEPTKLRQLKRVSERIAGVRDMRLKSKAKSTRDFAAYPALFRQISQPDAGFLAIPEVSSERRSYIPIAFFSSEIICSNTVQLVPHARPFHFGILISSMHMAWVRYTCGRLKSDFRYSKDIVYNNFPWPQNITDNHHNAIEAAAQGVLDARAQFPEATLADLYDPLTIPPALLKAHRKLDRAVDAAYSRKKFSGDADRVAFLFEEYAKLTQLPENKPTDKRRRARRV